MRQNDHARARAYFPRGLAQPEDSFRFSTESLLLACFAAVQPGTRFLDLGTGCGVISLGLLCRQPAAEAVGVDIQPDMARCARLNAEKLGFGDRLTILEADLAANLDGALTPGSFDLVVTNPPYRDPKRGRLPPSSGRRIALFAAENTLALFCATAASALKDNGVFAAVYPAQQEDELLRTLLQTGFSPARILPVQTRTDQPPLFILVESVKKDAPEQALPLREESLILYENGTGKPRLSASALAFCPFLDCNR